MGVPDVIRLTCITYHSINLHECRKCHPSIHPLFLTRTYGLSMFGGCLSVAGTAQGDALFASVSQSQSLSSLGRQAGLSLFAQLHGLGIASLPPPPPPATHTLPDGRGKSVRVDRHGMLTTDEGHIIFTYRRTAGCTRPHTRTRMDYATHTLTLSHI